MGAPLGFAAKYLVREERLVESAGELRYRTRDGRAFIAVAGAFVLLLGIAKQTDAGALGGIGIIGMSFMVIAILAKLLWPTDVVAAPAAHRLQVGYWFAGFIPRFKMFNRVDVESVGLAEWPAGPDRKLTVYSPVLFLKSGVFHSLPAMEDKLLAIRLASVAAPHGQVELLDAALSASISKIQLNRAFQMVYRLMGLGAVGFTAILPIGILILAVFYEPGNTFLADIIGQGEACEYSWAADKGRVSRIAPCDAAPEKPRSALSEKMSVARIPELTVRFADHGGHVQTDKVTVAKADLAAARSSGKLEVVFWPDADRRRVRLPTRDTSFWFGALAVLLVLAGLIEAAIRWFNPIPPLPIAPQRVSSGW